MPVEKIVVYVPTSPVKVIGVPGLPQANDGTGGMTQAAADARYIQQAKINQPSGVAGLDTATTLDADQLPLPPITLTILFDNQIA